MLKHDFNLFLKEEWLESYNKNIKEECNKRLQDYLVLEESMVKDWAGLAATYHKACQEKLISHLKGDRIQHYHKGNRLVIDQLITDYINPKTIIVRKKNCSWNIAGIDVGDEKIRIKHSEIIARDILVLLAKCPNPLEGIFTYLSAYTEISLLTKVEIERIHHNVYSILKAEADEISELSSKFRMRDENLEEAFEWPHKEHEEFIMAFMRYSVGAAPLRNWEAYLKYKSSDLKPFPIIKEMQVNNTVTIDLDVRSEQSPEVAYPEDIESYISFTQDPKGNAERVYGVGGYMELRPFYTTTAYKEKSWIGDRWRTMHMGIDLWCPEGTTVYCPVKSRVYSVYDNDVYGDYGPTVILKVLDPEVDVFLLFGHLSRSALMELQEGEIIDAGDIIGYIGDEEENGQWPPHLHFQVIRSMFHFKNNYAGVCDPLFEDFWREVCPSPYDFLAGFGDEKIGLEQVLSDEKFPKGTGSILYDTEGQRFLDLRPMEKKYGINTEALSQEEVEELHEKISLIILDESFYLFKFKILAELEWVIEVGKSFNCIDSGSLTLYENLRELLYNAKILIDLKGESIHVQMPHSIGRKELQYFLDIIHIIEERYA